MLDDKVILEVTNRDNGVVGYTIPDLGLHRSFQLGETKKITMEELRKLSYIPGGDYILRNCLVIKDADAIEELLGEVEPEYNYSEQDIKNLLLTGSLDALLDCLDFAPAGVVELVKSLAVSLEINDISKRNAILEKTGFNVSKAIEINHETNDEKVTTTKARRTTPVVKDTKPSTPARRTTTTSKYNVTKIEKK